MIDLSQHTLCKDAFCIVSRTPVGESDERETADALEGAMAAYLGEEILQRCAL